MTIDFIHSRKDKTSQFAFKVSCQRTIAHTVCWLHDYLSASSASPRLPSSVCFVSNWRGSRFVPSWISFLWESNEKYPPCGARIFSTRWRSQQQDGNLNVTRALLPDAKTSSGKTAVAPTSGGSSYGFLSVSFRRSRMLIPLRILNGTIYLISRTYKKPYSSFVLSIIKSQKEIDVISNVIQWNR